VSEASEEPATELSEEVAAAPEGGEGSEADTEA
jgi:hypothetical protein